MPVRQRAGKNERILKRDPLTRNCLNTLTGVTYGRTRERTASYLLIVAVRASGHRRRMQ